MIGPSARFPFKRAVPQRTKTWTMVATAFEASKYYAGVFRVARRATPTGKARAKLQRALLRAKPTGSALAKAGTVPAYREAVVRFPKKTLKPGFYVYAVQLFAETNPTRKSFFVSKAFQVKAPKGRR